MREKAAVVDSHSRMSTFVGEHKKRFTKGEEVAGEAMNSSSNEVEVVCDEKVRTKKREEKAAARGYSSKVKGTNEKKKIKEGKDKAEVLDSSSMVALVIGGNVIVVTIHSTSKVEVAIQKTKRTYCETLCPFGWTERGHVGGYQFNIHTIVMRNVKLKEKKRRTRVVGLFQM
jgi:hypothetical protein